MDKHDSSAADLYDGPSKSQRKRDMLELQALGEELVELPAAKFARIVLPESLRVAVAEARRITAHGGRKRQLQYIGRLMRDIDAGPIRATLAAWQGQSLEQTVQLHTIERWRERLLADEGAFAEFVTQYRGVNTQHLRALIRAAREEQARAKPPHKFRELFQEVKRMLDGQDTSDDA